MTLGRKYILCRSAAQNCTLQEEDNMNIGLLLIAIIGGAAGILSTVYLTVSLPAILVWKIYRKVAKGIPMTM